MAGLGNGNCQWREAHSGLRTSLLPLTSSPTAMWLSGDRVSIQSLSLSEHLPPEKQLLGRLIPPHGSCVFHMPAAGADELQGSNGVAAAAGGGRDGDRPPQEGLTAVRQVERSVLSSEAAS